MRYYAVRYKSAPDQIRIARVETPEKAFKMAFGSPPILIGEGGNTEYKDLGSRVAVLHSDKKRIALLKDPTGWQTFIRQQKR